MIKHLSGWLLAVVALLSCANPCQAQFSSGEGIQGTGTAVIERLPEVMRMSVIFTVSGKDLPDAIEKLKAQRAKLEQQLETLGAAKDSVKFGSPKADDGKNDNQRQMQMMLRQRMRAQGKKAKASTKAATAKPVPLSMKVTADWPLTVKDDTELLLVSTKLQDKIKAADLANSKEASEEKSAEEEEMAEEMAEMEMNYGGNQEPKPGEAVFAFVARIPDEARVKAMAEAFKSAFTSATRLSNVAGLKLGELRNLSSNGATETGDNNDRYLLMRSGLLGAGNIADSEDSDQQNEAITATVGKIRYRLMVNATFAVK